METINIEIPDYLVQSAHYSSFIQMGASISTSFDDKGLKNPGEFDLSVASCVQVGCGDSKNRHYRHCHLIATHSSGEFHLWPTIKSTLVRFRRKYIPYKVSDKPIWLE